MKDRKFWKEEMSGYRYRVPSGFWNSLENQRSFLDNVGKDLGIKKPEDWYKVKVDELVQRGARSLLDNYRSSLFACLSSVYPEVKWHEGKFGKASKGYWNDLKNQRERFDRISKDLNIQKPSDWYKITAKDIHRVGGGGLITLLYKGGVAKALQAIYPEYQVQNWRFAVTSRCENNLLIH